MAQPCALFTTSFLLRKVELNQMEMLGVILRVEPTSILVVVLKKSGSVHICTDLGTLNESIPREVHPLPTDETLAHPQWCNHIHRLRILEDTLGKEFQLYHTFW